MTPSAGDLFSDPRLPEALARLAAPGGYEAFESQVQGARFCRRPVRLKGAVVETLADGTGRVLFDSSSQPDRVLLKACGTRRQTLCPPCASIYRGDAFALVAAGLRGGKGMPEEVSNHPAVLVTLTAPSFGVVHRTSRDGSCHRSGPRCPHGTALRCGRRQAGNDPELGQALCRSCYDYDAAVLFNASVSELWRRTTIYALRALGNLAGLSVRAVAKEVRLSYVKVAEFQRRGSVHLHALVRLDAVGDGLSAPPERFSADLLATALELAARRVSAPVAGTRTTADDRVRWGRELDVAIVTDRDAGRRRAAAYLAKYSTKSTDDHGVLDHRLRAGIPDALELPAHLRSLVESAWRLGGQEEGKELRLRAWAHTAGYRGHCLTKSRRFSTTFAALRATRQEWTVAEKRAGAEADVETGTDDDQTRIVSTWTFVGMGYTTAGDAWLAESIAEEERLARRCAYEERQDEMAEPDR
ncbi:MAG TPA: replication initiator [Acidimicrobiales bacterium]|nr:replication initiator [Acidimicrobiales bacterium]